MAASAMGSNGLGERTLRRWQQHGWDGWVEGRCILFASLGELILFALRCVVL